MKKMKQMISMLVVCAMVFAMVGCGSDEDTSSADTTTDTSEEVAEETVVEEESGEAIKIGFSPYTLTNEYFSAVEAGVQAACDELGWEMISNDPQSDSTVQAQQIDDMIAQGITGLIYIPNDSQNVISVLQACQDAGVYVINVDNVIQEDDYDLVSAIIASDNWGLGALSGNWVGENHPDGAEILIVHLQTAESCAINVQGFWDGIEEVTGTLDNFNEVQVVEGGGATDIAYTAVSDALSANPEINVIYCINDTSAAGAIQAVADAGLEGQVDILGKDAAPIGKQAIADGEQVQSSGQRPSQMGYDGVYAVYDILSGVEIEFNQAIEAYDVNVDNIDEFDLDTWDTIEYR